MLPTAPSARAFSCLILLLVGCSSGSSTGEHGSERRSHARGSGAPYRIVDPIRGRHAGAAGSTSAVAEEAELRVRVEARSSGDAEATPIKGAIVRVAGLAGATDAQGDAVILGLTADDLAVVSVRADGYLGVVRRIEALSAGTNRMSVQLTELSSDPEEFSMEDSGGTGETGLAEVTDPAEAFALSVPKDGLVDALGAPYAGDFQISFVAYETHEDLDGDGETDDADMAWSPGPLLAAANDDTGDDTPEALQSLGMVFVELTTLDGQPLSLAAGTTATLEREVPEGLTNADGEALSEDDMEWWYLDEGTGLWTLYDDVATTVTDGVASVELPHFCFINLDVRMNRACLKMSTASTAESAYGAELRVTGGGVDLQVPADAEMTLKGMPRSRLTLGLYLFDALVAEQKVERAQIGTWKDGACSMPSEYDPITLEGPTASAGADEVPVMLRLRSGDCPGDVSQVTIQGGEVTKTFSTTDKNLLGGALLSTSLAPGVSYTVHAYDSDGVAVEASSELLVEDTSSEVELLTLEVSSAATPLGGCAPLPCVGAECDSRLVVQVNDLSGAPMAGEAVQIEGVGRRLTDSNGTICEDMPGLADRTVTVSLVGGAATQVELPRGITDCDDLSEGVATFTVESGEGCADGFTETTWDSQWLGAEDPAFYESDTLAYPLEEGSGTLTVDLVVEGEDLTRDDVPLLGWIAATGTEFSAKGALSQNVWAWSSVSQASSGSSTPDGVHLRADFSGEDQAGQDGLRLDIQRPLSELLAHGPYISDPEKGTEEGAEELAELMADITLTMHLGAGGDAPALRAPGDVSTTTSSGVEDDDVGSAPISGGGYDLPSELVELIEFRVTMDEHSRVKVTMDGARFEPSALRTGLSSKLVGADYSLTLNSATWTAPLIGALSFGQTLPESDTRALYGARHRLVTEPELPGTGTGYGPSDIDAELETCVPSEDETRFYLVGEAFPDAIPGVTPLLTVLDGEIQMVGTRSGTGGDGGGPGSVTGFDPYAHIRATIDFQWIEDLNAEIAIKRVGTTGRSFKLEQATRSLYSSFAWVSEIMAGQGVFYLAKSTEDYSLKRANGTYLYDRLIASTAGSNLQIERDNNPSDSHLAAPDALYQIDRAWLSALYTSEGLSGVSLDTVGSALVTLDLCPDDDCDIELSVTEGSTCTDFAGSETSEATFAPFLNLDPSCGTWDAPYLLTWTRTDGSTVAQIPFIVEAGTALVLR